MITEVTFKRCHTDPVFESMQIPEPWWLCSLADVHEGNKTMWVYSRPTSFIHHFSLVSVWFSPLLQQWGSHPSLLPAMTLKTGTGYTSGTHAGIRWRSRRSPSSTAGHWRKAGTSHSQLHMCYVCNCTPVCQIHSLHTHWHVRYTYTWKEKGQPTTGSL